MNVIKLLCAFVLNYICVAGYHACLQRFYLQLKKCLYFTWTSFRNENKLKLLMLSFYCLSFKETYTTSSKFVLWFHVLVNNLSVIPEISQVIPIFYFISKT